MSMRYAATALVLGLWTACCPVTAQEEMDSVSFVHPAETESRSNDGTISLTWQGGSPDSATYILERSANPEFSSAIQLYQGKDTARYVTGLPEGSHFFRIRTTSDTIKPTGESSPTIKVVVDYVSPKLVWSLLVLGLIALAAIVTAIGSGHRHVNQA